MSDGLSTMDVSQIDNTSGMPLICEAHPHQNWCGCRSRVVADGADGPVLWHAMRIDGGPVNEVDVNITANTALRVSLYVEEWPSDRSLTQMEVSVQSINDLPPFKDDPRLTRVGWLNDGEGRGVLRELIINRFAGIFIEFHTCKSRYHSEPENQLYRESRKHPARAWDWDYLMWRNQGICPPCKRRTDEMIAKALQLADDEMIAKATATQKKPWEIPFNDTKKVRPKREIKDFRPKFEPASNDEGDVPF